MATQAVTPITTIQELLAAHAVRIEGYGHLRTRTDQNTEVDQAVQTSQTHVAQLMEELAAYGDAAQSEVNRDTPLHKRWSEVAAQEQVDMSKIVEADQALTDQYRQVLENSTDLPESLRELLEQQVTALSAG